MRLLLVSALQGQARGFPYELMIARNGEDAFRLLDRTQNGPAAEALKLIVLDLNLPMKKMASKCYRIRKIDAFCGTP